MTNNIFSAYLPAGPPSAPINVISSVNGTSVSLEWGSPVDRGGRSDVVYNVSCQRCAQDWSLCEACSTGASVAGGTGLGPGAGLGVSSTGGNVVKLGGGMGSGVVARTGLPLIRFIPQQTGLTDTLVTVLNLAAHANYTFRIHALNGVSQLSNEPPQFTTANITTNQAGKEYLIYYLLLYMSISKQAYHRKIKKSQKSD